MNNSVPYSDFPVYDGITVPPYQPVVDNLKQHMKSILNLRYVDGDVLICGFPKSGSHWLTEIIHMLTQNTLEYAHARETTFTLEALPLDNATLSTLPKPRKIRSHLPFRLLPLEHLQNKGKIVLIHRNPKDVAVSFYNHLMKDILVLGELRQPWEDFITKYINGDIDMYGGWLRYEQEWDGFEKSYPDYKIHRVHYEDLKQNPIGSIRDVSDYLGLDISDDIIQNIAHRCSFENMKSGKEDITGHISIDHKPFIYRKGEVGDWKNWFTVAQNELFDAKFRKKIKELNLSFKYNL